VLQLRINKLCIFNINIIWIHLRTRSFFSSPEHLARLWWPTSLLSMGNVGFFLECKAGGKCRLPLTFI